MARLGEKLKRLTTSWLGRLHGERGEVGRGSARAATLDHAVDALLGVLRSLPPPDRERGREAATILSHTVERSRTTPHLHSAVSYAVGGKGMMDWCWSPRSLKRLTPKIAAIEHALQSHSREQADGKTI